MIHANSNPFALLYTTCFPVASCPSSSSRLHRSHESISCGNQPWWEWCMVCTRYETRIILLGFFYSVEQHLPRADAHNNAPKSMSTSHLRTSIVICWLAHTHRKNLGYLPTMKITIGAWREVYLFHIWIHLVCTRLRLSCTWLHLFRTRMHRIAGVQWASIRGGEVDGRGRRTANDDSFI